MVGMLIHKCIAKLYINFKSLVNNQNRKKFSHHLTYLVLLSPKGKTTVSEHYSCIAGRGLLKLNILNEELNSVNGKYDMTMLTHRV